MWSYAEALAWLYARQGLGIKLGLGKVEALMERLGRPQDAFASIHVAGTNGKGSVVRMLGECLRRAGYNVGITTSPHLIRFTERVEINGQPIAESDVAMHLHRIRSHVEALDAEGTPPTFFEIVTALAFCHFAKSGVAWAVVETGMGGRLDATNILAPRLTVITTIDMDHMAYLGNTIGEIAYEKAGIMKPGVPCVTSATGHALDVLVAASHALQVPMSRIGHDYHVDAESASRIRVTKPTGVSQYDVGLAGRHQHTNAAVVVACCDALRAQGIAIPEAAVRGALAQTRHLGRLQRVELDASTWAPGAAGSVSVLVDGAHNPQAAHAVRRHLADLGWSGVHLISGALADKDWQGVFEAWTPLAAQVWCVPVRNPRTLPAETLAQHLQFQGVPATPCPDVHRAIEAACAAGAKRVLVAGSLFLAGEALATLLGEPLEDIRGSQ